jgi:hydroxymethylbilane synthase
MKITIGARSSPLSKAQVQEVLQEIRSHYPFVEFEPIYVKTTGDQDLKTSLRTLDRTDFFTKEIDQMLLKGECRLGIHSAKDLPFPLPSGLAVICLTKGIDSSDSLVLRPGETLEGLPKGAVIATSSVRREQTVLQLRQDLSFIDLRGTIGQRLAKLDQGEADGVVVAEAALIRLGLTHLNRIRLPGETVEGQGQLAIVARAEDEEMSSLFACMDVRQASVVK